jgi:hypothetical protein
MARGIATARVMHKQHQLCTRATLFDIAPETVERSILLIRSSTVWGEPE